MSQRIVFNGKTYDSLDEMPPKERKAYEAISAVFADKDANGVPDHSLLEQILKLAIAVTRRQVVFE